MNRQPPSQADSRAYRFKRKWRDEQRQRLLKAQGGRCATCPALDVPGQRLHQAHLVPWPGGDDTQTILLCAACHRRFDAARRAGRLPATHTPHGKERSDPLLARSLRGPHARVDPVCREVSPSSNESAGVGPGSPAFSSGSASIFGDCGEAPELPQR